MPRELTAGVLFIVLAAGVTHATWNAITKWIEDRLVVFAWIGVSLVVCAVIALPLTGLPAETAIWFAVASAAIHVVYDFALMNAYRLGAFNQAYPIARGTSPLLVAIGAAVFAGERLDLLPLIGILLLAAGLISLAFSGGRVDRSETPAVLAALGTGVTIAAFSLIDGIGIRRTPDPYSYMAFLFLLEGPTFIVLTALRRSPGDWVRDKRAVRGLTAGFLSAVTYGAVMWAQTKAPLAEVSALRETGVISAAVIGALFFKERFGVRRVGAAMVVALGIVLISR